LCTFYGGAKQSESRSSPYERAVFGVSTSPLIPQWDAGHSTTKFVHSYAVTLILKSNSPQDEYRLPEGMKRIGYDSDTGRYYYRDRDGVVWQGAEGAEFSEMTRGDKLVGVTHVH
jgi:hypothetical protein